MSTILTNKFRLHNALSFKEGFNEGPSDGSLSTNIYMSIGKSTEWSPSDIYSGAESSTSSSNIPDPTDHVQGGFQVWRNMIAAKKIQPSDVSYVIPRVDWKSGTQYTQYDDLGTTLFIDTSNRPFYVITDDFNVYKCLFNNGTVSTVKPESTTTNGVVETTDGYVWKYMYTVSSSDAYKFVTPNFIPVKRMETTVSSTGSGCSTDSNHSEVQRFAKDGEINIIARVNPTDTNSLGSGYVFIDSGLTTSDVISLTPDNTRTIIKIASNDVSSQNNYYKGCSVYFSNPGAQTGKPEAVFEIDEYTWNSNEDQTIYINGDNLSSFDVSESEGISLQILPSVKVQGDGQGCSAIAEMSGSGGISKVKILNGGEGYTKASVTFVNAEGDPTPPTAPNFKVIISPKGGHGFDAVSELGGFFVMVNTKFNFDEYQITTNNDFRQISLVKDPIDSSTNVKATENSYVQTRNITLTNENVNAPFENSKKDKLVFVDGDSNVNGFLVDVVQETSGSSTVKKVRLSNVNGSFQVGQTIKIVDPETDTVLSEAEVSSVQAESLEPYSGDVIFIEQRSAVVRDKNQIEDIKIILEF